MSDDLERPEPPERRAPAPLVSPPADRWGNSFFRLVQVCGLGTFLYEVFGEQVDRPWILLCAMAMLLGSLGLQAAIRVLSRAVGG